MEEKFKIGDRVSYTFYDIFTEKVMYRKGKITGRDGERWQVDNELYLFPSYLHHLSYKQCYNSDENQ